LDSKIVIFHDSSDNLNLASYLRALAKNIFLQLNISYVVGDHIY